MDNSNIRILMELTLEEAYHGVSKKIRYDSKIACTSCTRTKKCPTCKGEGYRMIKEDAEINIPAGIDEGMVIQKNNKGHQVLNSNNLFTLFSADKNVSKNKFGHLLIKIKFKKHKHFTRQGDDLLYSHELAYSETMNSSNELDIHHINKEKLRINIQQGIQDGKIFRIQGKGFKNISNESYGDLYIKFKVIK